MTAGGPPRPGLDRWLSSTNPKSFAGEHSGDITDAPDGASEFINLNLTALGRSVIIPQVYVYSGEGFTEVAENFFGFMTLDARPKVASAAAPRRGRDAHP